MKKALFILLLIVLLATTITSTVFADNHISPSFIAGQTQFVGNAQIHGFANYLTVDISIRGGAGWCMEESAMHVGLSFADFPLNSSGPIPGQFDFKDSHNCVTSFSSQLPVPADYYGKDVIVAIHLVVVGPDGEKETAWVYNCGNTEQQFPGKKWSGYAIFPAGFWQ